MFHSILLAGLSVSTALACPQAIRLLDPSAFLDYPQTRMTLQVLWIPQEKAEVYYREMGSHFARLIEFSRDEAPISALATHFTKHPPQWEETPNFEKIQNEFEQLLRETGLEGLKPDEKFLLFHLTIGYRAFLKNNGLTHGTLEETEKRLRNNFKSILRDHFENQLRLGQKRHTLFKHEKLRVRFLVKTGYTILGGGLGVYRELKIPIFFRENDTPNADRAADLLAYDPVSQMFLIDEVKPLFTISNSSGYTRTPAERIEKALLQLGSTLGYLRLKHGSGVRARLQITTEDLTTSNIESTGYSIRNNVLYKDSRLVNIGGLPVFMGSDL